MSIREDVDLVVCVVAMLGFILFILVIVFIEHRCNVRDERLEKEMAERESSREQAYQLYCHGVANNGSPGYNEMDMIDGIRMFAENCEHCNEELCLITKFCPECPFFGKDPRQYNPDDNLKRFVTKDIRTMEYNMLVLRLRDDVKRVEEIEKRLDELRWEYILQPKQVPQKSEYPDITDQSLKGKI